jgi:hypothetical protein
MAQRGPSRLPILAALLLVAGCSSAPAPSGTSPASGTPAPATSGPTDATTGTVERSAWQQVLDQIGPDGSVSKETALELFSIAFGPLPGVTIPSGPAGPAHSGTGALRLLASYWTEIDAAQSAEAVRLVPELAALAPATSERSPANAVLVSTGHLAAQLRPPTFYTVLAQSMATEIEANVHVHLTLALEAHEGLSETAGALAESAVLNAQGGTKGDAAKCVITVTALGAAEAPEDLENTVGHEVWHCYQGQIRGLDWYWVNRAPLWVMEGQAEWVGSALRPSSKEPNWPKYINGPGTVLFKRAYDAVGFYDHLTQSKIDTWSVLIPMLEADDNLARFKVSGADGDPFLDSWASGYFRDPGIGAAWEFEGPGLEAGTGPTPKSLSATNGNATPFSAPAFTNAVFNLSSSADILVFDVTGHARLGDPGTRQDYVLGGGSFCTKSGGCICPPGTSFAGAPPTALSPATRLAITGGPDGTNGTVTGHPLTDFCRKESGDAWSTVFWSSYQGESAPPILAAYTCNGLHSTWHVIYLPGVVEPQVSILQRIFDLPFDTTSIVHRDFHFDIPPDKLSLAATVDDSIDFTLDDTVDPPVIRVSGTKTESSGGQSFVFPPRDFGSDAPWELKNFSLETQLKDHPEYQHPFRTQALQECGG